jgi:hypothetical protein
MQRGYSLFPYRTTKQSRLDFSTGVQHIALLARVAIIPPTLYIPQYLCVHCFMAIAICDMNVFFSAVRVTITL